MYLNIAVSHLCEHLHCYRFYKAKQEKLTRRKKEERLWASLEQLIKSRVVMWEVQMEMN